MSTHTHTYTPPPPHTHAHAQQHMSQPQWRWRAYAILHANSHLFRLTETRTHISVRFICVVLIKELTLLRSDKITIMSMNCRGLGDAKKNEGMSMHFIRSKRFNIVFLQDTHGNRKQYTILLTLYGTELNYVTRYFCVSKPRNKYIR